MSSSLAWERTQSDIAQVQTTINLSGRKLLLVFSFHDVTFNSCSFVIVCMCACVCQGVRFFFFGGFFLFESFWDEHSFFDSWSCMQACHACARFRFGLGPITIINCFEAPISESKKGTFRSFYEQMCHRETAASRARIWFDITRCSKLHLVHIFMRPPINLDMMYPVCIFFEAPTKESSFAAFRTSYKPRYNVPYFSLMEE